MSKIKEFLSAFFVVCVLIGIVWGVWSFVQWVSYQTALEGCNNSLPYGECTCKEGIYTIVCSKQVKTSNSWTITQSTITKGDWDVLFP
jgi:hypothetical protein